MRRFKDYMSQDIVVPRWEYVTLFAVILFSAAVDLVKFFFGG